jgi:galactokinase
LETTGTVPQLADAIAAADAQAAGALMMQSQRFAEEALENQVPQTRWLAKRAVELGATGATAFGAGFGGAVWALVASGDADAFAAEWGASYLKAYRVAALRGGAPMVMIPSAGMQREVIS